MQSTRVLSWCHVVGAVAGSQGTILGVVLERAFREGMYMLAIACSIHRGGSRELLSCLAGNMAVGLRLAGCGAFVGGGIDVVGGGSGLGTPFAWTQALLD